MQPQNVERDDFDFTKRVSDKIDKQIQKIDYSSYKKLAFLAVAIGVFVSAGIVFTNHIAPSLIKEFSILTAAPSQVVIQNLNNQVVQLPDSDFDITNQYYKTIMNMYDNKLDYVNKTLIQYNLQTHYIQTSFDTTLFKSLSNDVNTHKEKITETINKITFLRSKVLAKDPLTYTEAQFILTSVEQAKQHGFYHNSAIDSDFNKILVSGAPTDVTKYLMENNVYDKIKVLDDEIKHSFQNNVISNDNTSITQTKPKI